MASLTSQASQTSQASGPGTAPGPSVVRLPLSAAQRDIWMAHDLDPTGCRYNIGEYQEIRGAVDPERFAAAWLQLVREADALRVRGTECDEDGVWQLLADGPGDRRLECVDLTGAGDPPARARAWAEAAVAAPFDLAAGPLSRHALLKLGDEHFCYVKSYHHLVLDGMGSALLDRRLAELYERALADEPWGPSPFGTLPELLDEDAAHRASDEAAADRLHWAEHLAGVPETPRIAEGRTPVAAADGPALPFVRRTAVLDPERTERLRAAARGYRTRWSMLMVALVAGYVHRISGRTELLLGLPVTGRTTDLTRRTPGMSSNVVPLRVRVAPGDTLGGLVRAVVAETRHGLAHQRTRYEDMCRDLGLADGERRLTAPLVNIMAFAPDLAFGGLPTLAHNLSNGPVEDLAIGVYDLGPRTGLRIDFDAAPEVCDVEAVAGHQDRFLQFVDEALGSPELALRDIGLLDAVERRLVLEEWSGTSVEIEDRSLAALFEEQARIRPEHPAVVFEEKTVGYRELNERANRLAHHLAAAGLRRGDIAGVLIERGIEFAVAILAVIKTGAGYALLDPEFPDERLQNTALDAAVTMLVTDAGQGARLSGPWRTVRVDEEAVHIAGRPARDLATVLTGDDVACVMFTSGSTGRPKGILSSHRNLISTLTAQTYCTFGPTETFLQCSPVSWDAFSLEYWGALLHGGTTILQPGQRPEPTHITELTTRHSVTMLQLSSTLFNHLTDEHPHTFTTTHTTYTGGEPASPTHTHKLHQHHPHLTITNGYGPAESMGFTTTHTIQPTTTPPTTHPIGTPLTNKHTYILDTHLNPTPPGTTGELYLTGHGLAHGYHHQPTTTATHFIPNPYGPPGTRLYRTGDRAYWDADGRLHYAGRTDAQIKIRGFRVEPTEIETTLTTHPRIAQAAVTTHPDRHGIPQLIAYVTAESGAGGGAPGPQEIRTWLRTLLPDHMVPSFVTVLDRIPFTANGKIDKRALPAPVIGTVDGRAPRTPLEEILCGLFTEMLAAPAPLTIDDNFFDLGGHSMLAARLTSRIGAALSTRLTVRDIFQSPTPALLAEHLGVRAGRRALPPLAASARSCELPPLSFAQQRLWLVADMQQDGAGGTAYNVPMSVRLSGRLDVVALRAAFADVVARHEPLRTVFVRVDGEPRQRVLTAGPERLSFEHRMVAPGGLDAERTAAAGYAFDLGSECPLRVTLFQTGEDAYELLVVLHHIATDGQSLRPLFGDLATAYAARLAGAEPQWPAELPLRYADFAQWQRRALGDAADPESLLAQDLAHWRSALAGLPEELGLTLDRPRPAVASHRGGAVPVDFGPELYGRIAELARAERCTPFMVVHAALAALLTRLGAGTDLPIGAPVAGRSDEGLAGLVGFFVNTVVLRTDTSQNPSFRELLGRVRAADLDAYAHQESPFDLVLEAVNPQRSLARHPLFQVCLALEAGAPAGLELAGVRTLRTAPVSNGSAKFDLEFLLSGSEAEGLSGAVVYAADLFDRSSVERMAAMLRRTLEQAVADPGLTLGELELLDAVERRLVLEEWSGTSVEIEDRSLAALFEEQARIRPEHPAVVFEEKTVGYRELNERANRLAHHLAAAGLRRGDIAGVLIERGIEFAVAILAVIKTGAGYALLDPEFPDERLQNTALDAAVTMLVTDAGQGARLSGPWRTVRVDEEAVHIAGRPARDLATVLTGDDVACVMFTSGSTGRPKGILSSHRNLISTLTAQTYCTFGPTETFLQCSPVSWDAFSLEYWGALLHGGTTILQPGQRPEPTHITELTTRHSVTMLQLSSTLFNHLTDEHPHTFTTTHTTYTGGEPASPTHTHKLHQHHPHLTITNGYGPAESMGFTTTHTIQPTTTPPTTHPIGTPLTNKHTYILDTHLNPTPPGTTGELYLTGHGLAHGYHHQPTTTATHFIPNPYGPPGTRLYRTGDLVRRRIGGELEYVGRADQQVKIRGFRVEPGEVEAALLGCTGVAQATVQVREDVPGQKRLVGYVVPEQGDGADGDGATTPAALRERLRRVLPDHMVPAQVVVLERMPFTANGKIDKRALPAPAVGVADGRAPRTPVEETLCALFAEVLGAGCRTPTIDDNFFDLGGHSLLASRLTGRIGTTLDTRLTTRDVFQHPTPAALAAHLAERGAAPAKRARPALRRRTHTDRRDS
ncbi:amino acid adenylation domain-containing protein [Streptomyces bambusae]|uniref:non-ribosomal peptide synthetase n=1 Tax=Streptomyces bambusae TaxID=1550616 RepID=UPI001CFEACF2|nr:non-ribosomal peptide synthetase [Streptomyces bambusae]MCB5163531.1 amino acid adenylation domain-containing protein [Streptomyces bambusae]